MLSVEILQWLNSPGFLWIGAQSGSPFCASWCAPYRSGLQRGYSSTHTHLWWRHTVAIRAGCALALFFSDKHGTALKETCRLDIMLLQNLYVPFSFNGPFTRCASYLCNGHYVENRARWLDASAGVWSHWSAIKKKKSVEEWENKCGEINK